MTDPLAGSPWSAPATVEGFRQSPPNVTLLAYADVVRRRTEGARALDIGCGAARNAVPLAQRGWRVLGVDYSWPMLVAASDRARREGVASRVDLALEQLPLADRLPTELVIERPATCSARFESRFRGPAAGCRIRAA